MDQPRVSASRLSRRSALALPMAALPATLHAQSGPTRPIVMVAPLAAGSAVDILARLVAEQWSQRLGQPVTAENRPAANGTVALGQAVCAAPDGHKAAITGQTSVAFNPVLHPNLPYDPLRDFACIGRLAGVSNALIVRTASPFRSVAGIVAAARAAPGRFTFSSGGVGSTHHISSVLLAQQAGVEFTHVPYRGAPQGILAAQTGEVDFADHNISTVLNGIRGGHLRALAVTSRERSPALPDTPTIRELGLPDYEMTTWIAVSTLAAVPEPVRARMEEATRALPADEAVRRRMVEFGFELLPTLSRAELLDFVRAEQARWAPVIRASGARLE